MNIKKKLLLGIVASSVLSIFAFVSTNRINIVDAGVQRYEINMTTNKNKLHEYTERGTAYDGEGTIKTELGNDIRFSYNDLLGANNTWHILESSTGSFQNIDPINGLESMTLSFASSGTYKVIWAQDKDFTVNVNFISTATSANNSYKCNFNNEYPNYFKLENVNENRISISAINIDMLCYKPYANLVIESNNEELGTVSGDQGTILFGKTATVTATPNTGVSFLGWYDGENKISSSETYSFEMPAHDIKYTAKFAYTDYYVNLSVNDSSMGSVQGAGAYIYNQEVTLIATPNEGYSFFGWYKGSTLFSQESTYSFTMPLNNVSYTAKFVKNYKLNLYSENPSRGSVSGPLEWGAGLEVTVTANALDGYALHRWENENYETKSYNAEYTFIMPSSDIELWAVFEKGYKVTVSSNDDSLGTVSGGGSYIPGREIIVTANTDGYFQGWFDEINTFKSFSLSYIFTMPEEDVMLIAKFNDSGNGETPKYNSKTNTISYGLYPQTHVNDETLISELNKLETTSSNGWYLYKGNYYTKEKATPYDSYKFNDGTSINVGNTYWFKCEQIEWNILSETNGEYYLLSSVLLEVGYYYRDYNAIRNIGGQTIYPNNYEYSDIRAWLNGGFYNRAFALNDDYVLTTHVDNSASTTSSSTNSYVCNDTYDKVFLPSYRDYNNENYGFVDHNSRVCKTTDYVRAKGAYLITSENCMFNGRYWTRSPNSGRSYYANVISNEGFDGRLNVDYFLNCARPAITLKVS